MPGDSLQRTDGARSRRLRFECARAGDQAEGHRTGEAVDCRRKALALRRERAVTRAAGRLRAAMRSSTVCETRLQSSARNGKQRKPSRASVARHCRQSRRQRRSHALEPRAPPLWRNPIGFLDSAARTETVAGNSSGNSATRLHRKFCESTVAATQIEYSLRSGLSLCAIEAQVNEKPLPS